MRGSKGENKGLQGLEKKGTLVRPVEVRRTTSVTRLYGGKFMRLKDLVGPEEEEEEEVMSSSKEEEEEEEEVMSSRQLGAGPPRGERAPRVKKGAPWCGR